MTFQPLPAVTGDTAEFWGGGANGALRVMRCAVCRVWFHPPAPVCPECLSTRVEAETASGRATVATYTVNVQQWAPDLEVPYVLAIVELDEQPVRLMTRIVECEPDEVRVGMTVEVVFRRAADDVWLPLFRPIRPEIGASS
jgi:uncharacterized protein